MTRTELALRRMLAFSYAGAELYCDDGELSDSRQHPFIDFLRDDVNTIQNKMLERGRANLTRLVEELGCIRGKQEQL